MNQEDVERMMDRAARVPALERELKRLETKIFASLTIGAFGGAIIGAALMYCIIDSGVQYWW